MAATSKPGVEERVVVHMFDGTMTNEPTISRRAMLASMGLASAGVALGGVSLAPRAASGKTTLNTKPIPSSGEEIPVVGMGTWITFNVGEDRELRNARTKVLEEFFARGGGMIDSSPMYGSSHRVVGYGLEKLGHPDGLISADKIWTRDGDETREQLGEIEKAWGVDEIDLMQVHNLLSWKEHLPTLQKLKADGEIGYVGITTSHGRRHGELAKVMKTHDIDFVQLTYNMVDREVEEKLLPLARKRDVAVIANRPFRGGSLVDRLQKGDHPLPAWAESIDCENWPQFLLKFIVSHPAVTCAIPATSQVVHMRENMGAARGRMPDAKMRKAMIAYLESL